VRRLDARTRRRIISRLQQIAEDPFGPHTKSLKNLAGRRSARIGGWRIIFDVSEREQAVNVSTIGPRGEVYREL
jgi:mRNA-degrading endonuclease RelE of RelBE toxin-antitoxin system